MVKQVPCPNKCKNGKIILFVTVKECKECHGKGYVLIDEPEVNTDYQNHYGENRNSVEYPPENYMDMPCC